MAQVARTLFSKLTGPRTESADSKETGSPNTPETGGEKSSPATESKNDVVVDASADSSEDANDATHERPSDNVEQKTAEEKSGEDKPGDGQDESPNYLTGTRLASLTFGLALATFVVALDNTIIATAIPRITTQFDSLNVCSFLTENRSHASAPMFRRGVQQGVFNRTLTSCLGCRMVWLIIPSHNMLVSALIWQSLHIF